MKALKVLLGIVIIVVAAGAVLNFLAPKEMMVEREVTISASNQTVWANISSMEAMNTWGPWANKDPEMVSEYSGETGKVGSRHTWDSQSEEVGAGYQEIVAINDTMVKTALVFTRPWESTSEAWIKMKDAEDGTVVKWGFSGALDFPMNIMALFMDMTSGIEADFDAGLADLKNMCEELEAPINGYTINRQTWETSKMYYGKRSEVQIAKMKEYFEKNLGAAFKDLGKKGITPTGMPVGIFWDFDMEAGVADMATAAPVAEAVESTKFAMFNSPTGTVLHIAYYGAYESSEKAHGAMDEYMKKNGMEFNEMVIEEYVTDPSTEKDTSKWLTNIYYFVK